MPRAVFCSGKCKESIYSKTTLQTNSYPNKKPKRSIDYTFPSVHLDTHQSYRSESAAVPIVTPPKPPDHSVLKLPSIRDLSSKRSLLSGLFSSSNSNSNSNSSNNSNNNSNATSPTFMTFEGLSGCNSPNWFGSYQPSTAQFNAGFSLASMGNTLSISVPSSPFRSGITPASTP